LEQRLDPQFFELVPFNHLQFTLAEWGGSEHSMLNDRIFTLLHEQPSGFVAELRGLKSSMTALHIPLRLEATADLVRFHQLQVKVQDLLREYGCAAQSSLFISIPIVRFKNTSSAQHLPSIEQWEECEFGEFRMKEWQICFRNEIQYRVLTTQYICHRGNLQSKFIPEENHPEVLDKRIEQGYGVELDVWCSEGKFWLGHDEPQYIVSFEWLMKDASKKYIHCKDGATFEHLLLRCGREGYRANLFYHTNEHYALTTRGHVIVHPDAQILEGSVNMMPEMSGRARSWEEREKAFAVCSDAIHNWKE
jgi:hypothetical protein